MDPLLWLKERGENILKRVKKDRYKKLMRKR